MIRTGDKVGYKGRDMVKVGDKWVRETIKGTVKETRTRTILVMGKPMKSKQCLVRSKYGSKWISEKSLKKV